MFCYQIAKTIASYVVTLEGYKRCRWSLCFKGLPRIDALIFTGGIGEKSFIKRKKIIGMNNGKFIIYIYIDLIQIIWNLLEPRLKNRIIMKMGKILKDWFHQMRVPWKYLSSRLMKNWWFQDRFWICFNDVILNHMLHLLLLQ